MVIHAEPTRGWVRSEYLKPPLKQNALKDLGENTSLLNFQILVICTRIHHLILLSLQLHLNGSDHRQKLYPYEAEFQCPLWTEEYRNQKRGGAGVKAMAVTPKTGKLVSAKILTIEDRENSDILLISKAGQTIRLNLKGVRKTSRVTQWVILTKLKNKSDEIVRASIIRESEDEEVLDTLDIDTK